MATSSSFISAGPTATDNFSETILDCVPDSNALLLQTLPSDRNAEGLQCIFIKNALAVDLHQESIESYGLSYPLTKEPGIGWILKNEKNVTFSASSSSSSSLTETAAKSFTCLQAVGKAMPFKKLDSVPCNSKIIVPAMAYLKLLQFFSVKNDNFSEWKRLVKIMCLRLGDMRSSKKELRISKTFKYVGHGYCRYKKVLQHFPGTKDNIQLSLFVSAKSKHPDFRPMIYLAYAPENQLNYVVHQNEERHEGKCPNNSIQIFPNIIHCLAEEGVQFFQLHCIRMLSILNGNHF